MDKETTQLEWECSGCAEYILQRIDEAKEKDGVLFKLTEEDLAMWIHDHFVEEEQKVTVKFSDIETVKYMTDFLNSRSDEGTENCSLPCSTKYGNFLFDLTEALEKENNE